MNYTKIRIVFKDWSEKYIDEDEVVVYQLSGDYIYIAYQNDKGQLHRDGGLPAIAGADGSKAWWENGQRHRTGGLPAVEWADGSKEWYENGQLYRTGGLPAREWADGHKAWFENGKEYTKEEIDKKYNK